MTTTTTPDLDAIRREAFRYAQRQGRSALACLRFTDFCVDVATYTDEHVSVDICYSCWCTSLESRQLA